MKRKLTKLFDLQKFHNNEKLAAVIAETHARYDRETEIPEDDLINVNAAGDISSRLRSPFTPEGKNDD